MDTFRSKIWWTFGFFKRLALELAKDLWNYYVTPYPILLILGAFMRFRRRLKIIWCSKKPRGRPRVHENLVDLIIDMKRCNPIWGAQRISDELRILAILVSKKAILKVLRENGFVPPKTKFASPSWRAVLDSFCRYWAMDFTTVFDSKGIQVFIFAIIEVPSRKLIQINSTVNPTRNWLTQQFRNCCISGHQFPAAMVHDRDGIYGHWLPEILKEFGCNSLMTSPRSPWENPFIERFNLTIKTELLNRSLLIDNNHIRALCVSYQDFYNSKRPHQGIGGVIPDFPEGSKVVLPDIKNLKITKARVMNGLVTEFRLAA